MAENPFLIKNVDALQVLDSRGDPTVEVIVVTTGGGVGRAIAPAGASKGKYEAVELRDGDPKKFCGRSVLKAVENVKQFLGPAIQGLDSRKQREIDRALIEVDGTKNKSRMGANAILATSLAVAKAAANTAKIPLFVYLGGVRSRALPIPMLNIINGGVHAGNELAIQEFLIVPHNFDSFSEALRAAVETYKNLKNYLKQRYGASAINVGDEGGFAPPMKRTEEALEALMKAISMAGYEPGKDIALALDAAATQFYDEEKDVYRIDGKELKPAELLRYWLELIDRYPIASIEDPFHEEAFDDFAALVRESKGRIFVIGDDIVVTNIERLRKALQRGSVTGVIVKPNQIGTLSETLDFIDEAKARSIVTVISHRSGETEDTTIAHLAVAVSSIFIKTGAPARGERTAKYNELLRIEHLLGTEATYMGKLVKLPNVS